MKYYLSLGSNIGDKEATLNAAIERIEERIGHVAARSSFYYSEPWGFDSQNRFCNLCITVCSSMKPLELLSTTEQIEQELGRTSKSHNRHYSDRTIDIDLLQAFLSDGTEITIQSARLTLPHPLMLQRDFVMIPLAEIRSEA